MRFASVPPRMLQSGCWSQGLSDQSRLERWQRSEACGEPGQGALGWGLSGAIGRRFGQAILLLVVWFGGVSALFGQAGAPREYPGTEYQLALGVYYQGDFATALKGFQAAARSGIRSTEGRWVDSICYYAMAGECYYQMGEPALALEQYTAALNQLLAHRFWMLRVEFPPALEPSAAAIRKPPIWGPGTRRPVLARFSDRYPILQGQSAAANERAIQLGGVVALPEYYLINANEIARCTAVALRRRTELMGVSCQHDPLTAQVVTVLSERPGPPNHWTQAWISVQLGLAQLAAGRGAPAVADLSAGVVAGAGFDHPLTSLALLELGKIAFSQQSFATAAQSFLDASLSAALFQQYDVVEEAMRWGMLTHRVTGQPGLYPPLERIAEWARRDSNWLEVSATTAAAQNAAEVNQTEAALRLIEQARRRAGRSEMVAGAVGARMNYTLALVSYQNGDGKLGDVAFGNLLNFQRKASLRLFEIGMVDRMFTSGLLPERVAYQLYSQVLREPQTADWAVDPIETLSVMMSNHLIPLEHWLEAALNRKEGEQALVIADRIRRHRFYQTLPMGGRLLALRWVLEAPAEALSENALLQRRDLLAQYPRYQQLSQNAAALQEQLAVLAPVGLAPGAAAADAVPPADAGAGAGAGVAAAPAAGEDKQREWTRLLNQLAEVSWAQETMLREMALRRSPSDLVFPPPLDVNRLKEQLPDRVLVLSFLATSRGWIVFSMTKENPYALRQLEEPKAVRDQLTGLLRKLGHVDRNQPLDAAQLTDTGWKTSAAELLATLTGNRDAKAWEKFDEIVIVPDGPLWYLPFEALPIESAAEAPPLIARVRVRYAPTLSLTLPDRRRLSPLARTALLPGQLFPREDERLAAEAVQRLQAVMPQAVAIKGLSTAPPATLISLFDRLLVWTDLDDRSAGAYDWSPLPLDRNRPGGTLTDWIALPWRGPQQLILPGFHTPAESSLKQGGTGEEVFLSVCGLMAAGSRTILLSRWRTGGQNGYDLTREFVQELPYLTAADAWQRSVLLAMHHGLDPEREPRLKTAQLEHRLPSDHPFFWSGYLLVDTGAPPEPAEAAPLPVAELKAKDK